VGLSAISPVSQFLYLFLLIPLNIFILLTTIKTNLPTTLFIKPSSYNKATVLWEIFFGFWLFINMLCLVGLVADGGHFSIPVNLFFAFILLTLRAGKLANMNRLKRMLACKQWLGKSG
jgi:hypothetical protein